MLEERSFSYAEIPRLYQSVLGATGSLKTLSSEEKKLLKDEYRIDKSIFTPSVFKSKLPFKLNDQDVLKITTEATYFTKIAAEIEVQLNGLHGQIHKRAVLVFFENKQT
jgi:hypothetical protein